MHLLDKFKFCPICGSSRFVVNDIHSKRCQSCGFVYYINPRAAVAAFIVDNQNHLLVCSRAKDPAVGTLDLPGGFTECFETAEEAVRREVEEETGLQVIRADYLFSLPNIYHYSGIDIHTMDLFFSCQVESFEHLWAHDDVQSTRFIPFEELKIEDFGLMSIRKAVSLFLKRIF